jgi:hypothetical protein
MKTSIPPVLITFSLVCFAFLQNTQAVSPAPDGGYSGGNTAEGQNALFSLTSGIYNTGIGIYSLLSLTDGKFCTGIGAGTLLANTADNNTGTGAGALLSNTTGANNTANGAFALFSNTTGTANIALGYNSGFHLTTGGNISISATMVRLPSLTPSASALGRQEPLSPASVGLRLLARQLL